MGAMVRYVALAFLVFFSEALVSNASGNIGCLFSESLCSQEKEWCYDDYAFGKCLPLYGNIKEENLYRYDLGTTELHLLEREMQRLFHLGYRWSHTYTQCVLQILLNTIKDGSDFDVSSCNAELDQDLEGALKAIEGEEMEHLDPRNLAIVRFTPSVVNPHSDYADELYYPPPNGELLPPYNPPKDETEGQRQEELANHEEGQEQAKQKSQLSSEDPKEQETNQTKQKQQTQNPASEDGPMTVALQNNNRILPLPSPDIPIPIRLNDQEPDYGFLDDYDYDFSFRSPYEALPPVGPVYKKRSGYFGNTLLSPRDATEGFVPQDMLGKKPSLNFALFRELAERLNSQKNKENFEKHSQENYSPMLQENPGPDRQGEPKDKSPNPFYHQGFLDPIFLYPNVRDPFPSYANQKPMGLYPEHAIYGSVVNKDDNWNLQLPELLPPNPEKEYFSEDIHPPYIREEQSDPPNAAYGTEYRYDTRNKDYFDSPGPSNSFANSVSRFDVNGEPVLKEDYSNFPDISLDIPDYQKDFQEDEPRNQNSYPFIKDLPNKFKSEFELRGPPVEVPYPPSNFYRRFQPVFSPNYYYDPYAPVAYPEYPDFPDFGDLFSANYDSKFVKKDEETLDGEYAYPGPPHWNLQRNERHDVKKPGPTPAYPLAAFRGHPHLGEYQNTNFGFGHYGPSKYKIPQYGGILEMDPHLDERVPEMVESEQMFVDNVGDMAGHKMQHGGHGPNPDHLVKAPEYRLMSPHIGEAPPRKTSPPPPEYVHVHIDEKFDNPKEAEQMLIIMLASIGLNTSSIQDFIVEEHEMKFRIAENMDGINAAIVAEKIEEQRTAIRKKTGKDITKAGVGPKGSMTAVVYSSNESMLRAAAIVCGVCTALLIAAVAVFLLKRHSASKAKLKGLTAHDSEASKDYQDLCRARMAGKGDSKEKGTSAPSSHTHAGTHATGQRISSLSKESDNGNNSPSSRSSTSSWSEEPVVSNMDISTGHMVLSYMEDHLRNKDRLEQEWIDLCAYEAEPNTCSIALKAENAGKNRYADSLPYDHNRVILTEHTNVSGSNYINASSITDHDPRNPAYIATQGPLAATAADFWQLVWEQGSVVIVMLTRLTENGQALCHRYWPEEGSELYHIYEVHLVSEHIWCDDFLVRSFYLKNVKTGETRTVTQFHFLSWTDSGVPASTKALLEFRRKVNKSYRGRSCPIIVHCSDGIGRTGTYCLIDMVLNRMAKGAKEIDIAATLEHIRDQRPNMVKTKLQFEFVLMAVAEEVHAILKALPQ